MYTKMYAVLFLCFTVFGLSSSQSAVDYPELDDKFSYCYEFTWFGPEYNNASGYNGTCDDYVDESRADEHIPCIPPLVISNDGTIPDINYLWENHRASVLCIRSGSQACVKYSYILNGIVTNQTHMCARVRSGGKKLTSGCYKQKQDGYEIELCVCESQIGLTNQPCNSVAGYGSPTAVILASLLIYLLANFSSLITT